jgi:hypothetical protein
VHDLIASAPRAPGVYYLLTPTRRLSYVGKATDLRSRLLTHARDPRWANIADVRWELVADERAALAREADVIIALQPPRNRAIRMDTFFSYVTVSPRGDLALGATGDYGCFPHLGVGAYSHPGRMCIDGFTSLRHLIRSTRPSEELVDAFLRGTSDELLRIDVDEDQPHVRHGIERDRKLAAELFRFGPKAMRTLRLRHGGRGRVSREQFVTWIRAEVEELLR